jgi:cob(I)alamin adenosyltransferase
MKSITSKFGDKGETRLYSGETVNKVSLRIQSVGDIDELVCSLGLAVSQDCYFKSNLEYIQRMLFLVGSEIATVQSKELITQEIVDELDNLRIKTEEHVILPKGFIIPGHQGKASAYLDMARAISRRCERSIIRAYNEGLVPNKKILIWMNRLSDYLYLLARASEKNYTLVKE